MNKPNIDSNLNRPDFDIWDKVRFAVSACVERANQKISLDNTQHFSREQRHYIQRSFHELNINVKRSLTNLSKKENEQ